MALSNRERAVLQLFLELLAMVALRLLDAFKNAIENGVRVRGLRLVCLLVKIPGCHKAGVRGGAPTSSLWWRLVGAW